MATGIKQGKIMRHIRQIIASIILLFLLPSSSHGEALDGRDNSYGFAPFGQIHLYRPVSDPRGIALLLSDHDGWSPDETELARGLADHGLLVAGASAPALIHGLEKAPGKCINPNYALIALARDIQHRAGVVRYRQPILIGYGAGATLAFGALAQWPDASYQGVISVNPTTSVAGHKPWCAAPGFATGHVAKPRSGWRFAPNPRNRVAWIILQQAGVSRIAPKPLLRFASSVPGARLIQLPRSSNARDGMVQLRNQLSNATLSLLPTPAPSPPPGQIPLPDMPLTLVPATGHGPQDLMAIAYSGDGGWVGIDRDIAAQIAAAGIPVVGVDSLSYFWTARTPQGAGHDLAQLIHGFGERWHKKRVLLIGYSFGADVLPHMIGTLDAQTRSRIASVSLLGLSASADFQFHLSSWLDIASDEALPTVPAILHINGIPLRCIRGQTETDSACPAIPRNHADQFLVPGDHHFNRNAALLAHIILGQRRPGFVTR
jgi:type IV secretory pathway VirJ component